MTMLSEQQIKGLDPTTETVDVTTEARRLGFRHPVLISRDTWDDCVRWTEEIEDGKAGYSGQDQQGRLRTLLWMALLGARRSRRSRTYFDITRAYPYGPSSQAFPVTLCATIGPDFDGRAVILIDFPGA